MAKKERAEKAKLEEEAKARYEKTRTVKYDRVPERIGLGFEIVDPKIKELYDRGALDVTAPDILMGK